jgi:hypothetical protein
MAYLVPDLGWRRAQREFFNRLLRFNQEGSAMDIKFIAKPLAFASFTTSGSRFDGWVAFRSAGEAAFGPPG